MAGTMSKKKECASQKFNIDSLSVGLLIGLITIDALVYLIIHIQDTVQHIIIYKGSVHFLILKIILTWFTVLTISYSIPHIAYKNIIRIFPETKTLLNIFRHVLSAIIIISLSIILTGKKENMVLVPAMFTIYFVCMGWWIQSINTAKNSRRSHTLNVILGMKTNSVYQDHLSTYDKLVPNGFYLGRDVCESFFNKEKLPKGILSNTTDLEKSIIYTQVESCLYVLNYFEFISCAIRHGDLDEELIKECYKTFFQTADKSLCFLMVTAIEKQPTAFEYLRSIVTEWHGRSMSEDLKNSDDSEERCQLGKKSPTPELIAKMRAKASNDSPETGENADSDTADKDN